jgi:Na+/glutamate symporter
LAASCNTFISAALVSGGYLWYLQPKLGIPVPVKLILKLGVTAVALAGVFYSLSLFFDNWWVNTILAGLAFLGLLVITQVINIAEVKANLRSKNI